MLAYSALADLLSAVDESVWEDLPVPQQQGLAAALLRRHDDTEPTDPRAVAAAFVAVIDRLAAQGPVVIAVDDLQWLDTSSANIVSFAARRLPTGAALLCTTRTEEAAARIQLPSPDGVRRIPMQPLTIGELHRVLMARLGISVSRPMLLRIHEISGGNPFFALELAREIDANRRPTNLSLPGSLGDLVSSRIARLGADTEDALLAIASLPDPTVQIVADAAGTTPIASSSCSVRPKLMRSWRSTATGSASHIPSWRMESTAAHRRVAAAKCTGVWPNWSPNPNYAPTTSPCPTPLANPKPSRHWTRRQESPAPAEPPPRPLNC